MICGFVGLGQMGGRMVKNLLQAGHEVIIHDVLPEAMALYSNEATVADSPRELMRLLAKRSEGENAVVFTMLPDPATVEDVYCSEEGLLDSPFVGSNMTFIDCSTIDLATAKRVGAATKTKQSLFADAPVGGAVPGAEAGTLTFMIGCDAGPTALSHIEGPFNAMGSRVVHCGPTGSGQAAKLCNNMVLATTMVALSEGLVLGKSLGLDSGVLTHIFNTSSARCWASEVYNPVPDIVPSAPSSRNYEDGWPTSGMQKDMTLALEEAAQVKSPVELSATALKLYDESAETGRRGQDFSSVYDFLDTRVR